MMAQYIMPCTVKMEDLDFDPWNLRGRLGERIT